MNSSDILARLSAMEHELRTLRGELEQYFAREASPPIPMPEVLVAPPPHGPHKVSYENYAMLAPDPAREAAREAARKRGPAAKPRTSNASLEQLIAGRGFYAVGLLLVFLAAGYFLKIAFDQWIGPVGRVALGVIAGIGIAVAAMRVKKPDFRVFADGIIALGFAIELIAIYAATSLFHLITDPIGGALLAVAIAALGCVANQRKSEALAIWAAIGGFLAPPLLGIADASAILYIVFLALLDGALMMLAMKRAWMLLPSLLFAGSIISYAACIADNALLPDVVRAMIAVAGYFAFAALPVMNAPVPAIRRWISGFAGLWLAVAIESLLGNAGNHSIEIFFIAIAVGHAALARSYHSHMHKYFAFMFGTFAINHAFGGTTRTLAYILDGLSLYYAGIRERNGMVRAIGAALFAIAGCWFWQLLYHVQPAVAFGNERFTGFAILAGALIVVERMLGRNADLLEQSERDCAIPLRIIAHGVLVNALSMEAWDIAARFETFNTFSSLPQVAVSIVWTACAAVLIAIGLQRKDAVLRWEGLVLIGATVVKVLSVDLASQDLIYRVISAFVVGIVVITIAAQYQHRGGESKPDN